MVHFVEHLVVKGWAAAMSHTGHATQTTDTLLLAMMRACPKADVQWIATE